MFLILEEHGLVVLLLFWGNFYFFIIADGKLALERLVVADKLINSQWGVVC